MSKIVGKPSRSSGSSSTTRGGNFRRTTCTCGLEAVVRIVKNGVNVGSRFYGCSKWPDTSCKFMKWIDNIGDEDLRFEIFEKDTVIAEMEMQNTILEEKVKKLEGKKFKMEELVKEMKVEVGQLKNQLTISSRNETQLMMALLLSWLLFVLVVLYLK